MASAVWQISVPTLPVSVDVIYVYTDSVVQLNLVGYRRMLVENVLARHWSSPIATTPHSRSRDDRRLACRKDPLRGSDTAATGRRRGSSRRVLSRLHATQNGYEDPYAPLEPERFALDSTSDERALVIETGAIGRQANGAVLARQGDTVITLFSLFC